MRNKLQALILCTLIACADAALEPHKVMAEWSGGPVGVDTSGNPVYAFPGMYLPRGGLDPANIVGTTGRGGQFIFKVPGANSATPAPPCHAPAMTRLAYHPFSPDAIRWYEATTADPNLTSGDSGVDQGKIDDCWFESAVAAVSRTAAGARLISEMITSPDSFNFTVIFPDAPDTRYVVSQARAIAKTSTTHDSALWARVLQLAFLQRYPIMTQTSLIYTLPNGKVVNGNGVLANRLQTTRGMLNVQLGLQIMTGHEASAAFLARQSESAKVDLRNVSVAQLRELLTYNENNHIVMTAATPANAVTVIVPEHAYTVLSYSADNKVILRNPWGHNNPSLKHPNLTKPGETKAGVTDLGQGLIEMDLADFHKYYRVISYSRLFHT